MFLSLSSQYAEKANPYQPYESFKVFSQKVNKPPRGKFQETSGYNYSQDKPKIPGKIRLQLLSLRIPGIFRLQLLFKTNPDDISIPLASTRAHHGQTGGSAGYN